MTSCGSKHYRYSLYRSRTLGEIFIIAGKIEQRKIIVMCICMYLNWKISGTYTSV
jgi:hypothetical protein